MATTPAGHLAPQPHESTSLQVLATQSPGVFRLIVVIISGVIGMVLLAAFWALCSYFRRRLRRREIVYRRDGEPTNRFSRAITVTVTVEEMKGDSPQPSIASTPSDLTLTLPSEEPSSAPTTPSVLSFWARIKRRWATAATTRPDSSRGAEPQPSRSSGVWDIEHLRRTEPLYTAATPIHWTPYIRPPATLDGEEATIITPEPRVTKATNLSPIVAGP